MIQKIFLTQLIDQINVFDESIYLYLPKKLTSVDQFTECLLLDDEEFDKTSEFEGFECYGGLDTLKDILENLRLQVSDFSKDQALQAIDFYIKNDAFIDLYE